MHKTSPIFCLTKFVSKSVFCAEEGKLPSDELLQTHPWLTIWH